MSKIALWINCARPKTLAAAIAPVIVGAAVACADGPMNWPVLIVTLLSAIFIQVGTNFANDYYDHFKGSDTEGRIGPQRGIHTGQVSPTQMKQAFIIAFGIAVLLGIFLVVKGGWPIVIIGIVSVVCGYLYTGGPFPLAYVGLGDVFVLIFFGPVATGGTYYLQRGHFSVNALIAGLATGLLATAILAVNNFRDFHTDKAANKNTLVVRLGQKFGLCEYAFCVSGVCVIPVYLAVMNSNRIFCLLALLTLPFSIRMIRMMASYPPAETLNTLLANTGKLLIVFSLLFAIGWVL
jgi:1,4-dihydroxy-2-naphthoate octaprenyltransferase